MSKCIRLEPTSHNAATWDEIGTAADRQRVENAYDRPETRGIGREDRPRTSRSLEKDHNLRYQSAAEMRPDLKRLLRDTQSGVVATAIQPRAAVPKKPIRRKVLPLLHRENIVEVPVMGFRPRRRIR